MSLPRSFQTFAEFDRDFLRETTRIGQSVEDLVEETAFDADLDFSTDKNSEDDY